MTSGHHVTSTSPHSSHSHSPCPPLNYPLLLSHTSPHYMSPLHTLNTSITLIHTSSPLHLIPCHPPRIHSSCLPIGCPPPRLPVHNQFITVKVRRRVSYSRDKVCLASESSVTDREHGDKSQFDRSTSSRTLQRLPSSSSRDLLIQPVVSSGLQQLAGMPLRSTQSSCSVTPRPIFCQFSSSSACISFCLRDSSSF
jgi:hypothetical protein